MLTTATIEEKLRHLKPRLRAEFNVASIGYFGSYAKGQEHEDSDLDIVVYFDHPLGWSFVHLKELLEKELDIGIDLISGSAIRKDLKDIILSETRFI